MKVILLTVRLNRLTVPILITVLVLSIFPVFASTGSKVNSITNDDTSYSFDDAKIHSVSPEPSTEEIVIFADNHKEFDHLHSNFDIINSYQNLMAVTIEATTNDIDHLISLGHSVYPLGIFRKAELPNSISDGGEISINGNTEASTINVTALWDLGYSGQDITIAVFDNGVDFSHEDLNSRNAGQEDFSSSDTSPCKTHGTPVAGAAAANNGSSNFDKKGTGYSSMIHDIAVGCESGGTISGDFLGAFDFIIGNNDTIDVINTSWGGGGFPWNEVLRRIEEAGQILVGSAGNAGPDLHTTGSAGPGNGISAISAAASSSGSIASFSSRGPPHDMIYKPDIAAPGVNINLPKKGGGYNTISGTSFSSPLTAGAIATLLSAINSSGYAYNPGVIKAAILKGADSINGNELEEGQGIVNLGNSWDIIQNANTDGKNLPQLVEVTPKQGPFPYIDDVPAGVTVKIPITLISSNPSGVSISFSGDLSGISSVASPIHNDRFSQQIIIEIDTTGLSSSTISGKVKMSLNGDEAVSTLNINVGGQVKKTVGLDLHHTYWDQAGSDQIGGANIGKMIELMMQNDIWVEEINTTLTSSVLSNYDMLWMPDPLSNSATEYYSDLTSTEINNIVSFVEDGNDLFVDFLGELNNGGTDSTKINPLISNFDISAHSSSVSGSANTVNVVNDTSLGQSASTITHYGNYLSLSSPNAQPVAMTSSGQISTARYTDNQSGGQVLISSTNFWLDNNGIEGNNIAGSDDTKFANDVINWFVSPYRLINVSTSLTVNTVNIDFSTTNSSILENPINVTVNAPQINRTYIPIEGSGNDFTFDYPMVYIANYTFTIQFGDQYLIYEVENEVDGRSNEIVSLSGIHNFSRIYSNDFVNAVLTDDIVAKMEYQWNASGYIEILYPYEIPTPSNSGLYSLDIRYELDNGTVYLTTYLLDVIPSITQTPLITLDNVGNGDILRPETSISMTIVRPDAYKEIEFNWKSGKTGVINNSNEVLPIPDVEGNNKLTIEFTLLNYTKISYEYSFYIDVHPPKIVVDPSVDLSNLQPKQTISVNITDPSGVLSAVYSIDGTNITMTPPYSIQAPEEGGTYDLIIFVEDNAGRSNSKSFEITIQDEDTTQDKSERSSSDQFFLPVSLIYSLVGVLFVTFIRGYTGKKEGVGNFYRLIQD